jgi:hypothetical protein
MDPEAWNGLRNNRKTNSILYFRTGSTQQKPREEKEKVEEK